MASRNLTFKALATCHSATVKLGLTNIHRVYLLTTEDHYRVKEELRKLNTYNRPVILWEFNGHTTQWGTSTSIAKGRTLATYLHNGGLQQMGNYQLH